MTQEYFQFRLDRYRTLFLLSAATMMLFVSGCGERSAESKSSSDLRASCFDVTSDNGAIHLLIGQPAEDKALDFFYLKRKSTDQTWPEPIRIPTTHATPGNHHRGNDPQIAVHGERLMALWTAKGGGPYGSGPIATALSNDGGRTWTPGPSPTLTTDDAQDVGYRFPATVAGDGAFHVVWIHAEDKERSLRYSRLAFDSKHWSEPTVIDPTSCACCWNEIKINADGELFVLYRDEQPRDMALAVSKDRGQTWNRTGAVGDFNWDFNGCPHVGGGLALTPGRNAGENLLVATVWTGQSEHSGAYVLTSGDNGQSWSATTRLGLSKIGRHTDTTALSPDKAAVAWDEPSTNGQSMFVALTEDGGKTWGEPQQLSAAKAKYPRLLACDDQFFVLWSEDEEKGTPRLRMELIAR
ncbi:MAG: exo-alpha-sialidase [Verrucomicrobia bacterium]|nr:exo-alpha-sialidase [Verrucomicrobiota bacterium]